MSMSRYLTLFLYALVGCCGFGCQPATDDPDLLKLQLNWFPEVEHGGYYAAQVHGYFEEEGLNVEILPGGPNVPVIQALDSGRADFAVTNADRVVFAHDADVHLVTLLAPMQHSPRCIMVHRDSGITKLEQLQDITLAVGSGPAFYKYMAHHLPLRNVETVAYPGSVATFVNNPQFAQQAYVFSEPYLAQQQGADPVALLVSEMGYDPYASLLVVRQTDVSLKPDVIRRFVRASVRGWQRYLEDSAETNDFIRKLNPDMNAGVLDYGVKEIAKLCQPEEAVEQTLGFGGMTDQRWRMLVDQLAEIGLVDKEQLEPSAMFTNSFLK